MGVTNSFKNMKTRWYLLGFMLLLLPAVAFSQSRIITGRVSSKSDGVPLAGINVVLKGTTTGTVTGADGAYSITVPDNKAVLVFAFIGFITKEVPMGVSNVIDVVLEEDTRTLNEVVVVGYATRKTKRSITGAAPTTQIAPALSGRVAGVQVSPSPGYYQFDNAAETEANTEEYGTINENIFRSALQEPLSTFSIDVDAASYSNVRRFIQNGQPIPKDAVRIEEMINYFDYDYAQPTGDDPFSIYTEVSAAPWNDQHKLVHIGLQGRKIPVDNLPASNLVFLIDVIGIDERS